VALGVELVCVPILLTFFGCLATAALYLASNAEAREYRAWLDATVAQRSPVH
jgi:hypothetical protein